MTTQTKTAENGVNVAALLGAREALSEAPEAARFKWRASSAWIKGTHNRATVDGFFGLGGEQKHRQTYQFDSDHPEIFASEDKGATPLEFVSVGLAGCLSAGIASVAQHRNIQLHSVKVLSGCWPYVSATVNSAQATSNKTSTTRSWSWPHCSWAIYLACASCSRPA